ncbi:MAG: hypothetical protein IPG11_13010 [Flavobacteriales bacterium]|nr:hypothetical protein [Flavobacteriales bacterium]
MFSGTFSASYPLGGVATPGGLSYDLLLNYSGAMTGGATPTLQDGIPYGQGWSLNLPTITMKYGVQTQNEPDR